MGEWLTLLWCGGVERGGGGTYQEITPALVPQTRSSRTRAGCIFHRRPPRNVNRASPTPAVSALSDQKTGPQFTVPLRVHLGVRREILMGVSFNNAVRLSVPRAPRPARSAPITRPGYAIRPRDTGSVEGRTWYVLIREFG